jgi:hypothetical protein
MLLIPSNMSAKKSITLLIALYKAYITRPTTPIINIIGIIYKYRSYFYDIYLIIFNIFHDT